MSLLGRPYSHIAEYGNVVAILVSCDGELNGVADFILDVVGSWCELVGRWVVAGSAKRLVSATRASMDMPSPR